MTAGCWDYEDEKHTGLAPELLGVMGETLAKRRPRSGAERALGEGAGD